MSTKQTLNIIISSTPLQKSITNRKTIVSSVCHKKKECLGMAIEDQTSLLHSTLGCLTQIVPQVSLQL
jgi:hypothetical protein